MISDFRHQISDIRLKSKNKNLFTKLGFTLLEIMVAVSILGISLVTLMRFQGQTLIASARAERITLATMLVRQKMVDTQIELEKALKKGEFPEERDDKGDFEEPFELYRWEYNVRSVDFPAPAFGEEGSLQSMVGKQLTKEISKAVRELKVTVLWDDAGEEQSLDLVTHWVKL